MTLPRKYSTLFYTDNLLFSGEEFTVDEFGQPTLGTMDNLYIGTLEEKPADDSDKMKMEIDQFKVPGRFQNCLL